MVAASGLGRAKVDPMVAGVGSAVALAVAGRVLMHVPGWLDCALCTLVNDLQWTAVVLWAGLLVWAGLALVWPWFRRSGPPFGDLLTGPPWSRLVKRIWTLGAAGAVAMVLLPNAVPKAQHGLSARVVADWRSPGETIPARRVNRLAFYGWPEGWRERPLHVSMTGWLYVPVAGDYNLRLHTLGDALLEIDGTPIVGLGSHEAELTIPWATDPDGARRVLFTLARGFHRINLFYRQREGAVHLVLRWGAPFHTTYERIPDRFLLPGDASAATRRWRGLFFLGRRVGILVLALLLVTRLAHVLVGVRPSLGAGAANWPSHSCRGDSGESI
jgi:hypothetical protein